MREHSLKEEIQNLIDWYREAETIPDNVMEEHYREEETLEGMEEWLPDNDQELIRVLTEEAEGIDEGYSEEVIPQIMDGLELLGSGRNPGYPEEGQEKVAAETLDKLITLSDSYLDRFRNHE